jgi:uncharacterized membrane protein
MRPREREPDHKSRAPLLAFAARRTVFLCQRLRDVLRRFRLHVELITLTDEHIEIDSQPAGQQWVVFPRHWAQVKLRRAARPLRPSRLLIMSHGRSLEVGSFLREEQRRELAERLRRAIGRVDESPPLAG